MKISISRCMLILAVAAVPIRMSVTEHGQHFWAAVPQGWSGSWSAFAWEWSNALAFLGLCSFPEMTDLQMYQAHGGFFILGMIAGAMTNIVAILCLSVAFSFAWKATATKEEVRE